MTNLNWTIANDWETNSNSRKEIYDEPKWKFDCGFKLDFDGSLIRVSSRFYPPHKNKGDWWEGTVSILFLEETILDKEFKCNSLNELRDEVETFVKYYVQILKSRIQ